MKIFFEKSPIQLMIIFYFVFNFFSSSYICDSNHLSDQKLANQCIHYVNQLIPQKLKIEVPYNAALS
jgi:hypothetical protein